SGYLPFPPRSCLALPLALARAPHRGAPCLLRPVLGAGNTGVGSPHMRSTAGKRAETVPSLARVIAGGSSVFGVPLPLAIAAGSSGGANQVRGTNHFALQRLRERRPTLDITGPPRGNARTHESSASAAPVHVVVRW